MPANQTFTPARAAKQVGVPGSTLRHWSKVYKEFLSDVSNPEPGTQRAFTGQDVETLRAVAQLRANGIGQDEIIARLRENPTMAQQKPLERPTIADSALSGENTQPAPLQSIVAVSVGKVDALDDKVTDMDRRLDRRLERLESSNNRLLITVAVVGGALVVSVIVLIIMSFMPR